MPRCLGRSGSVRAMSSPKPARWASGGPDLLAVEHPLVAVALGPRGQAGHVRPGAGLAEQLAPDLLAGEERPEVAALLLVGAVGHQGGGDHAVADDVAQPRRRGPGLLQARRARGPGARAEPQAAAAPLGKCTQASPGRTGQPEEVPGWASSPAATRPPTGRPRVQLGAHVRCVSRWLPSGAPAPVADRPRPGTFRRALGRSIRRLPPSSRRAITWRSIPDSGRVPQDLSGHRALRQLLPPAAPGRPDDDLGDVVLFGELEHLLGRVLAGDLEPGAPDVFDQAPDAGQPEAARCPSWSPRSTWTTRSSPLVRRARRAARRTTASLPGAPVTATMMRSAVSQNAPGRCRRRYWRSSSSVSSATKRSASSRSATRFSVLKNPLRAPGHLFDRVDVAVEHPAPQLIGRGVDQLHLVRLAHHPVRDSLADLGPGDLLHRVGDALEVLDVDGADDTDAGVQQIQDVLPALLVGSGPRDVGVGQLVDQGHVGVAFEHGGQVHLLEGRPPVLDPLAGTTRGRGSAPPCGGARGSRRSRPPRRPRGVAPPSLVEHGARLAHPRRRAQVDAEPAGRTHTPPRWGPRRATGPGSRHTLVAPGRPVGWVRYLACARAGWWRSAAWP